MEEAGPMPERAGWTGTQIAVLVILLVVTNAVTGAVIFFATPQPRPALIASFALSSAEQEVIYNDIIPLFEERRGVDVQVVDIRPEQLIPLIRAQAAVGRAPVDVFGQDNLGLADFVEEELIIDLSAFEEDIDENVLPALIDAGRFGGKLMYMPWRPNLQITYYDKAEFSAAGLTVPTTWDELKTVATTFTASEGTGRVLFKFEGTANMAVMPTQAYEWIASASTGTDINVISQQIVEFKADGYKPWFEFLLDIKADTSPASATAKWDTSNEALAGGTAFWMQNWPFGVAVIPDLGFPAADMGTYAGVAGPERTAHVLGGSAMGIPKHSTNPTLALEFIDFLQSKEVQEILARDLAWIPIRDDALDLVDPADQPHFESMTDVAANSFLRPNVVYFDDWMALYHEAWDRIYNDLEDIDTVLAEMETEMAAIIAGS